MLEDNADNTDRYINVFNRMSSEKSPLSWNGFALLGLIWIGYRKMFSTPGLVIAGVNAVLVIGAFISPVVTVVLVLYHIAFACFADCLYKKHIDEKMMQ